VIDQLIPVVYDQINSNDQSKNKNTDKEKIIDSIYEPFLSIARSAGWDGQGFDYDKSVIVTFNKFLSEVHSNSKKAYLVKFENDEKMVHGILGLKHPPLMKVFDISYWVTTSGSKNNSLSDIDHILSLFFSAEGFKNSSSGSSAESENLRQLLVFISCFYKNDIKGMLEFLKKYDMKEEFAFLFSYHCYIALLSGNCTPKDQDLDYEQLALSITFVLFQQIYSSIALNPTTKFDESIINVLNVKHTEIVNEVYKIDKIDFINNFKQEGTDKREHSQMVDVLMSGEIFKFLEGKINIYLDRFLTFNEYPVLKNTLMRIKQFFLFSPRFYQNMNRDSNFQISSLIDSAMNLRRIWNDTKRDFKNKKRDLLYFDAEEFIKKIMEPTKDSPDFSWMNVSEQDKRPLTRTIFPTIMFSFIYLKTIRLYLKKNDNTQKLNLLKQSLNLIWRMCKEANKDPLDDLKFKKSERVGFLNRYTALLYHLKVKKSNIMILKELLDFARSFIFVGGASHYSTKLEDLIDSLKLDSFMELYDYLEDLQNVKEITENHKENIINLFIQITSQCPKFQKHVTDIKYLVKLIQGDWSRLDYLIEKTFKRRENVSGLLISGDLRAEQPAELHRTVQQDKQHGGPHTDSRRKEPGAVDREHSERR
jgi:hypothetical protein